MSKNKKIKFIDFIKRDFEEEFDSYSYASYTLLWYKPDIVLLYAPVNEIINNNGDILYEYKFLEDTLKDNKYSIETTIVNIESTSGIKPYYFFFATNAMLPMYDPLVDEQFFDCIKKHEDRITFKLDEILNTLKKKIKSEVKNFDPLSYRCCSIDEEINFFERLKESE